MARFTPQILSFSSQQPMYLNPSLSSHDAAFTPLSGLAPASFDSISNLSRETFSQTQYTMFFLAECILLLSLTFAIVSFSRSSLIQKAWSFTSHGWSKRLRYQSTAPTSCSYAKAQHDFTLPPLKTGSSSKMNMGLKRLDKSNWLSIDKHYYSENRIRASQLDNNRSSVLQCLPGSEIACAEVLDLVSTFLTNRYPDSFTISATGNGETQEKRITNHLTGESFSLSNNAAPLETAARLAMEDFNILVKDEEGEYRLQASATLFPAGWRLEERIGDTMKDIHGPVPKWKEALAGCVNRYGTQIPHSSPAFHTNDTSGISTTSPPLQPWSAIQCLFKPCLSFFSPLLLLPQGTSAKRVKVLSQHLISISAANVKPSTVFP
jgi:hypothetical protein